MRILSLIICLLSHQVMADVLSEHNEQHTAVMAAQNLLFDSGCTRTNITRLTRYTVEQVENYYVVSNKSLRVDCMTNKKQPLYSITWTPPAFRQDGREITSEEIAGYQLLRHGKIIDMSPCCEFMTSDIDGLSIRTIDVDGLASIAVEIN